MSEIEEIPIGTEDAAEQNTEIQPIIEDIPVENSEAEPVSKKKGGGLLGLRIKQNKRSQ